MEAVTSNEEDSTDEKLLIDLFGLVRVSVSTCFFLSSITSDADT